MRIKVGGKHWSLIFTKELGKKTHGECDPPTKKGKQIRIRQGIREKSTLETLIHEMLHAADFTKDEPWVHTTAEDITRVLWKLGYRKQNLDR